MGNCLQNCKLSPKESLRTATADTVPAVQPPHGWCKVIDAYDADTCRCAFQTPEGMVWFTVRLVGLDAPERRPKKEDPPRPRKEGCDAGPRQTADLGVR